MHYNLTQYAVMYGGCNESNNNLDKKDSNFRIIFDYAKPDILTVNEIGNQPSFITRFMNNNLNINGVTQWEQGELTSHSGGQSNTLANMVFYNSDKLQLYSSQYIANPVRDFNVYRFYYLSDELKNGDTVFFSVAAVHLKAGTLDAVMRGTQAQILMDYLDTSIADNYILCGDMNIYKSSEAAYQTFTTYPNEAVRFHDPIAAEGNWNNNAAFAHVHTQSTHSGSNGCLASGGLDDRFDLILVNNSLLSGNRKMRALAETYHAIGQDGLHFNKSVNDSANNAVPAAIANALYNMSDHLPICMDFELEASSPTVVKENVKNAGFELEIKNPVADNLELRIICNEFKPIDIRVISLDGKVLFTEKIKVQPDTLLYYIPVSHLRKGTFVVEIGDGNNSIRKKFVKL